LDSGSAVLRGFFRAVPFLQRPPDGRLDPLVHLRTANHIIDDGIEAARMDYIQPGDTLKREGAIAGFDECRNKEPAEIAVLLVEANERANQAIREDDPRYWYWRCRALEIGWVANVLSNILVAHGTLPIAWSK
jgi:hypothetical protein